jgi:hypothetical protein
MVRDAGTETTGSELTRVMATPPAGAAAVNFTVPVAGDCPPTMDVGWNETLLTVTGMTCTAAVFATPLYVPVTVTLVAAVT